MIEELVGIRPLHGRTCACAACQSARDVVALLETETLPRFESGTPTASERDILPSLTVHWAPLVEFKEKDAQVKVTERLKGELWASRIKDLRKHYGGEAGAANVERRLSSFIDFAHQLDKGSPQGEPALYRFFLGKELIYIGSTVRSIRVRMLEHLAGSVPFVRKTFPKPGMAFDSASKSFNFLLGLFLAGKITETLYAQRSDARLKDQFNKEKGLRVDAKALHAVELLLQNRSGPRLELAQKNFAVNAQIQARLRLYVGSHTTFEDELAEEWR
jgi:hypothetical protein